MEICYSVCPHDCPDTCSLKVEIDNGNIIKVAGDPSHPVTRGVICEKVRAYPERIYNPSRILYPMRRTGEKGGGGFERISWEEAVETIVKRWQELIKTSGPESILPYSYGGTEGVINHGSMDRRLFNKIGATRLERTICSTAGNLGYQLAYGKSAGINPIDTARAKLIIFWGINALETNMHQAILADNARKNGAKIIAIDVHENKTAKWADEFYLILPGSDGALALGLAHIIIRDGLADKIFLEKYSYGFESFKAKTKEYPPGLVADLTGITEKQIESLAYSYAGTKPCFIRIGNGLQHHNNGGINTWAISLLPALVGAWKDKGGGALKSNSGYFPLNDGALERPDLLKNSPRAVNMVQLGKVLCELNPPVRSIYIYNSNPAVVAPNQNLVLKGLAREDLFTVVHEQVMTDTAKWADIILPATTSFEHADLYKSYWHTSLQWANPVIARVGEAKPNIDVFKLIAKGFGFTEPCFEGSEEDIAGEALDLPYWREQGVTLGRLKKERFIMLNVLDRPFAEGSPFTQSGKIEFKSEKVAKLGLKDIPDYKPIREKLKEKRLDGNNGVINSFNTLNGACEKISAESEGCFPLTLITPPNHFFLNSTFADTPSLKNKSREPFLEINPEDAKVRGIKDGDIVKVENGRGSVVIKAKVIGSVLPGVVVSAGLWRRENYKNGSGVNVLTPDNLSDIGGGATFFSTSVEVKKNNGGFSLVEIIMVIILLGIIGIIGTVGLNSAVSSNRGMYERQLQSAIRYAQNYAMSHFTYTAVVFSASGANPSCALGNTVASYSGYAVCACNGATPPALEPLTNPLSQTTSNFYVTMGYGISYSVSGISANYIAFNSAGEPGGFAESSCSGFTALSNINNISFGASPSQLTFYVYPVTGLVSYNGNL